MTPTKIFLATPMYGGVCYGEYLLSVLELSDVLRNKGWELQTQFIFSESLINRARNDLTKLFLESDCTHLLFIDADIGFNPHDVVRMVEEDKEVLGGVYPKKTLYWENVQDAMFNGRTNLEVESIEYVFAVEEGQDSRMDTNDLKKCIHTGTGYMLIKREVFAQIEADEYQNNSIMFTVLKDSITKNYFNIGIDPDSQVLLSEDYYFCKSWRNAGGTIYVAPYARAMHVGVYKFGFRTYGNY
jgi:hypothetical protein